MPWSEEPARPAATPRPSRGLPPWRGVALVAAGGSAGALARTAQSAAFAPPAGSIPWSTFAENVTGAFALGLLLTVLVERRVGAWWLRPLLGTGLLGAYTTYATVGLELHLLVMDGSAPLALLYLAGTALAGLAAGGAGIALGRLGGPRAR